MKTINYFFLLFIMATGARAAVLLEPFMNYEYGNYAITLKNVAAPLNDNNGAYKYSLSGIDFGFRIGASFRKMFFGWQYEMGQLSDKASTKPEGATVESTSYDLTDHAVFLGYAGKAYRFWATYFYATEWEVSKGLTKRTKYRANSGLGVNIGYLLSQRVSLNLGLKMYTLSEMVGPSGEVKQLPGEYSSAVDVQTLTLGLSFPFHMGDN